MRYLIAVAVGFVGCVAAIDGGAAAAIESGAVVAEGHTRNSRIHTSYTSTDSECGGDNTMG